MYNLIIDMGGVLMQHNMPGCIAAFTQLMGAETMQRVLGLCPNGEGMPDSMMEKFESGAVSEDEFIRTILQACPSGTTREEVIRAWVTMHDHIPAERLEILRQWHDKGHHVILLSNSNPIHQRDVETHYDMSMFDHCFYSHLVGAHKPEKAIYQAVQDYLKAQKWEMFPCIFVDDIACNRKVGESFGWTAYSSLASVSFNCGG